MSLLDIVGGWLGNHAQQQQTQKGIDATNNLYGQARDSAYQWQAQGAANQQPYMKIGGSAVDNLNRLFGFNTGANGGAGAPDASAFHADPGYQFQQDEAQKAEYARTAATGQLDSGAAAKALQARSMGIADQSYGSYIQRLMGLVGVGEGATSNLNSNNLGYANALLGAAGNQSQILTGAYDTKGNEQAQMWSGITNGINNTASSVPWQAIFGG